MFAFNIFAIEWRVPYSIVGTIEVGTDEKEHVEEWFKVVGNTMRDAVDK